MAKKAKIMLRNPNPSALKRGTAAMLTILTVFALTSCVPDQPTSSNSAGNGNTVSQDTADPQLPDPNESQPSSETPDSDDPSPETTEPDMTPDGMACLYGNWFLDNASFRAILEDVGGDVREVTGLMMFTLAEDGSTSSLYEDWTTVVESDGATVTIVRNGEDFGTFSADDDGTLTLSSYESHSVAVMTMEAPGQPPISMESETEDTPLTSGSYVCDHTQLSITAEGTTSIFYREH